MALAAGCDSLDSNFPLFVDERMTLFQRLVEGESLTELERTEYYRRGARRTGARVSRRQTALNFAESLDDVKVRGWTV